jgi:hypothetical protein
MKATNHGIDSSAVKKKSVQISAQRPLQQERKERHHHRLAEAEERIALRAGEYNETHDRSDLVDEWDRRRLREAQDPIGSDPDDR